MVEQNLNILIVISAMIFAIVLAGLMLWSYNKSVTTFIAFYGFLVILYSSLNIIFIILKKDTYNEDEYNITFGASLFIGLLSFILMIYFGIKGLHLY
jgi:4-hydroxybenzoate polyprenyltransferase